MITSEDYVPPELHKQYLWCKWSFHPLDNIQDKKFMSTIHHPMDSCWRLSFYVSTHLYSGKRIQREWKHMMIKRVIIKKQCSFL
jgi:hypothetical protein